MKKSNAKLNYIYNLAFQIFALIVPLITTPYVSRTLSSEGVGQFSFVSSINSYFCMFASLGFSFYAQREIAKKQGDVESQSIILWEILICRAITGSIVMMIYFGMIISGVFHEYTLLVKIMSISLFSKLVDTVFFFQGNEKFKLIAVRDFFVRLTGIVLIFTFVKSQADLWIYALCNAGTLLISAALLLPCLKQDVVKISLSRLHPLRHFAPSVRLFIPTIAISIYTILDKTLIGILIPGNVEKMLADGSVVVAKMADIENGYYAQSEKIIKMAMTVLASLGTVMMPRNSKELADGREDNFLKNINGAIEFVFFIGAALWAGLAAISFNFSPWFFGDGFEKVPVLIIIFSTMIIPAGLGNVLGQQYLIPKGEDTKYVIVYVSSAVVNLALNIFWIPTFMSYGAAVASVIAESFAPLMMLIFLRGKISFFQMLKSNWKSLLSAAGMFICVYGTSLCLQPTVLSTTILIFEGIITYFLFAFILKVPVVWGVLKSMKIRGKRNGR